MLYIAENLKALRKSKEWTQEGIAEMLGVSPQSVSKWERGDTYPDITLLPALANLYKVSVDAIIGMNKINEAEARTAVFKAGHEHLQSGDGATAEEVFSEALKTFPNDECIMLELALVLALECDPAKLSRAANLCERVLSGAPTEKVRHTARAAVCFIYFKQGERDAAIAAAKNLPHMRESRECVLAEFRDEADTESINAYLRFLVLGGESQDQIRVDFGIDMIVTCTEHGLLDQVRDFRNTLEADISTGVRRLPLIRFIDNMTLPAKRVRVRHYADYLLDKDFDDPIRAVEEVMAVIREMVR